MESEWRLNVPRTGWGSSRIQLLARVIGDPGLYFGWEPFFANEGIIWYVRGFPESVPVRSFYQLTGPGFRFPGSLPVYPDT